MNESDPLPDDTEPLSEFDLFPIVPPLNGSFTEPHTVVTVTWPDESQSHWIECPLCHATPTTVTRFEDSVVYDFDYFGRVTVPVTEYGFMEEWLGFHKEAHGRRVVRRAAPLPRSRRARLLRRARMSA